MSTHVKTPMLVGIVVTLLLSALPIGVKAQETVMEPPPPPMAWLNGVTVDEHQVRASIDGPIAEVTVTQVFRNDSHQIAEGTFLFPLPDDAAVGDFQMTVNGQVIEGQLMDSDRARRIYEETVRQIRDPALLEYVGRGLFRTSVFPIPPGESRTLQLRYGVVLSAEEGLYRFTYPLRIPGASQPARRTGVVVDIMSEDGLRAVYSPSHYIELERGGDYRATARYESQGGPQDTDFELYYGLGNESIGLNLLSYRPAGEDGYFILLASPSIEVGAGEVVNRDVVFVVDVSGSMEGPKLAQAKEAVRYVVEHLNPGDRFNLVAFSTGARLWNERLAQASPDYVADALNWIDGLQASGSTDINRALLEALAQLGRDDTSCERTGYVLFMTDGLPTQGETEPGKIIRNALSNQPEATDVRLFTFGVGFDVNTDLLDTVSHELGGRSRYVRPDQQIDEAVSQFFTTIQTPVLTNVRVDYGDGPVVGDTYPFSIPDLFAGEQLVVAGRYRNGGEVSVVLAGKVNGEEVAYTYPNRSLVMAGGEPFVARLWATRKIGTLMDQIRRSGPSPEVIDAIVDLSMRYGIVTPYTSYLVEEPEVRPLAQFDQPADGAAAPVEMLSSARESVAAEADEAAAAPASGEEAVAASEERAKLQSANVVDEHTDVRFAGGKTFVSRGEVELPDGGQAILWVDTAYDPSMKLQTVGFASERFFELANERRYAEMLALSAEVLIVIDDATAVRITMLVDDVDAYVAPEEMSGSSGEVGDETLWGQFLNWLAGNAGR